MAVSDIPTPEPEPLQYQQLNLALLEEADEAFRRDLPSLLEKWRGYWVAYHGKERLGISYYSTRLRKRFSLPPDGRQSLWNRWFGSKGPRYPAEDLWLCFIELNAFEEDYEFSVEQHFDDAEPSTTASSDGQSKSA